MPWFEVAQEGKAVMLGSPPEERGWLLLPSTTCIIDNAIERKGLLPISLVTSFRHAHVEEAQLHTHRPPGIAIIRTENGPGV